MATNCYSPNPTPGKLLCGPNRSCPEGHQCSDNDVCWKSGACGASGIGVVGFLGQWSFTGGTRVANCSDNSSFTYMTVTEPAVPITSSFASNLSAFYFCQLDLHATSSTSASACAGQACDVVDSANAFSWTYHVDQLELVFLSSGTSATLTALVTGDYVTGPTAVVPNSTGTCTSRTMGTLARAP
jgi:hypothetical protein